MPEKLLIVDDDPDTLRLVGLMLERQGYQVITASDGPKAIELAVKELPDLILLDVMMPGMDGVEVAQKLRSGDTTEDIPIIMFTAKSQLEDKITGLEAGADIYLTKPTQPRELFAQVKALLKRSKKTRVLVTPHGERGHSVGVLSAKGGLGVSTLALNLGIVIRRMYNEDVIVAELRSGQGSIGLDLGYPNPEGLNRLLNTPIEDIRPGLIEGQILNHSSGVKLLLSSPRPKDAIHLDKVDAAEVIVRQLPFLAPMVIIDLGSTLTSMTQKALEYCDELIVIMEPSPSSINLTKMLLQDIFELGVGEGRIHVVLVNRVRSSVQLSWGDVQEQIGRSINTVFTPAPELAYQASYTNTPIVLHSPRSITTQQFEKLATLVTQRAG
jgi:CheY-like chemotaxis protein